jgi:hypothetical protein
MPRFLPPKPGQAAGVVRMVLWVYRDAYGTEPRTKVRGGRCVLRGPGAQTPSTQQITAPFPRPAAAVEPVSASAQRPLRGAASGACTASVAR